jgi:hypothetical protein
MEEGISKETASSACVIANQVPYGTCVRGEKCGTCWMAMGYGALSISSTNTTAKDSSASAFMSEIACQGLSQRTWCTSRGTERKLAHAAQKPSVSIKQIA